MATLCVFEGRAIFFAEKSALNPLSRILIIVLGNSLIALGLVIGLQAGFYWFIVGRELQSEAFVVTWTIGSVVAILMIIPEVFIIRRWRFSMSQYPLMLFILLCPLQFFGTMAQFIGVYRGELAAVAESMALEANSVFLLFAQAMLALLASLVIVAVSQNTRARLLRGQFLRRRIRLS